MIVGSASIFVMTIIVPQVRGWYTLDSLLGPLPFKSFNKLFYFN